ncbi:Na+/H+ antiporter [Listeria sp. PSOL-1]|uniref:Na+/H+ antiporter n=1 Tax=Listeria sp. PSOL-1 TaxID=1844999 RepID=UPI0013D6E9EA|nr:Na+/H+ antiporter [Listeria sp. PSOL-1]
MEIFLYVLLLLIAIFTSNLINRFVPFVSIPLIQIGLGIIIALLPLGFTLKLNPELFLVMFIAPLLFNDGRRTDKKALWRMRTPILLMALGLVFVTVIVIGYFVNWLIPSIPLAAAFALAASLAPTDAVAVGSLSDRINLPKRMMSLLEGEGLMNDASGLVAFQFAIAAMVTGTFSLVDASLSFVVIALGGILVGLIFSYIKSQFLKWVRSLGMEDITFHMLIQILTPFLIYLVAEELHVSGILAVVAGGIIHAVERKKLDPQQVKLSVVSKSTWSVIIFVLNGLVFLILGTQLPSIIEVVWRDSDISNTQVIAYILLITFALIALRFLWVYGFWLFNVRRDQKRKAKPRLALKSATLTSLSGVRGAVTLATALSIPFILDNGRPFPERALIIFIASGVILCSLLIATFILPVLARKDEATTTDVRAEKAVRVKIWRSVIRSLYEQVTPENKSATEYIIKRYRQRIHDIQQDATMKRMSQTEKAKRLEIISWQQENTEKLYREHKISENLEYRYQHYLFLMESALKKRFKMKVKTLLIFISRVGMMLLHPKTWKERKKKFSSIPKKQQKAIQEIQFLREQNERLVIERLRSELNEQNEDLINPLITEHLILLDHAKQIPGKPKTQANFDQKVREVEVASMQLERDAIQQLFEDGKISRDLAKDLRQNLNMMELYLFEGDMME